MHKIIGKNPVYTLPRFMRFNILLFMPMIALETNHLPTSLFSFPPQYWPACLSGLVCVSHISFSFNYLSIDPKARCSIIFCLLKIYTMFSYCIYPLCNLPVVPFNANANAIRTIQPWWKPEGNPSFQVFGVALAAAPTVPDNHSSQRAWHSSWLPICHFGSWLSALMQYL